MFHVKLSTALCSFLPFKPSFTAMSWRFSWNSIARGDRHKSGRQGGFFFFFYARRSRWFVKQNCVCEVTAVWGDVTRVLGLLPLWGVIRAKTLACTVNISQSLPPPPRVRGCSMWKCRDTVAVEESTPDIFSAHFCTVTLDSTGLCCRCLACHNITKVDVSYIIILNKFRWHPLIIGGNACNSANAYCQIVKISFLTFFCGRQMEVERHFSAMVMAVEA